MAIKRTHNFNYDGLNVKVEYYYTAGEVDTESTPGYDEEYDITAIYHGDILINDFIDIHNLWDDARDSMIKDMKENNDKDRGGI